MLLLLVLDLVLCVFLNYYLSASQEGRAQWNKGDNHKEGPCGDGSRERFT